MTNVAGHLREQNGMYPSAKAGTPAHQKRRPFFVYDQ